MSMNLMEQKSLKAPKVVAKPLSPPRTVRNSMKSNLLDSTAHNTVLHKRIVDSDIASSCQIKGDLPSTACSKKQKQPKYIKKKGKVSGNKDKLQKKKSSQILFTQQRQGLGKQEEHEVRPKKASFTHLKT